VPFIFLIIALLFSISFADSRALARGNAMIADTSASFATYQNSGMLAFKKDLSFALHAKHHNSRGIGGSFGIENGIGNRMGIGAAAMLERGEDTLFISETDSITKRADISVRGYAGLSYRLNKADGIGVSLSTESQSPLSFDLGWFRFWNSKWQSGAQVRNLGSDDSRGEILEAGLIHRNLLLGKPVSSSLMISGSLDKSVLKGRVGFEWEAIKNGDLRFGLDEKSPSVGVGYAFNIGNKTLFADYAIPLSITLRMKF
jgi:hypothetical protein